MSSARSDGGPRPGRLGRVLAWSAAACITAAVVVFAAVSAAGPSQAVVAMPRPAAGPPYWLGLHPSAGLLTFVLWGATAAGGAGVIAGLAAVDRGARPPVRAIMAFSFLAVAVLTVLPAAGSTDILDYAANGRMVATGHSPYVMTPQQLKDTGDPVGRWIPHEWADDVSVYGPLASAEEWAAAELGGTSVARIGFWLKLWNSMAFGAAALLLDRVLRSDPARRLRGHLLWTVNPLLLWEIVASGHIDGLSAAFGLAGVLVLRAAPGGGRPAPRAFALSGLLIGMAAALKAPYALFGLGAAWAGRRSAACLAAAAAGFAVIFGPAYAIAGRPAVHALLSREPGTTWDTMYQVFYRPLGYRVFGAFVLPPYLTAVSGAAFAAVAVLAFRRLPGVMPGRPAPGPALYPALAPALALSLAWLMVWSYQRPWYDVMVICLLAVYPASRLDWLVLLRLIITVPVYMPGIPGPIPAWLNDTINFDGDYVSAYGRLLAAVAFAALCVSGSWGWREQAGPALLPSVPERPHRAGTPG